MRNSKNSEEFPSEISKISNNNNKSSGSIQNNTLIFANNKIMESDVEKIFNTNISITEELNKSTNVDSTSENKSELVPFKFEWKGNDNIETEKLEIMITGTFLNNWNDFMPMKKNLLTNKYEYETYLSKKIHYFKYMVNSQWLCSDLYKTTKDDSNNINNYIDLSNFNGEDKIETNSTDKENSDKNQVKNKKVVKRKKKSIERRNEGYGFKYPLIKDLNSRPPTALVYYKVPFFLDNPSKQNKIQINNNSFSFEEKNNSNENKCYKKIFIVPHEKLGHMIPNINDIDSNQKYFRFSVTERKKHKFLTYIYFKPKEYNKKKCESFLNTPFDIE